MSVMIAMSNRLTLMGIGLAVSAALLAAAPAFNDAMLALSAADRRRAMVDAVATDRRDCGPGGDVIADRTRVTTVDAPQGVRLRSSWPHMFHDSPVRLAVAPHGDAVVAWTDSDGAVHVTPLDVGGHRSGRDVTGLGSEVGDVVAHDDGFALLVLRESPAPAAGDGQFGPDSSVHLVRYRHGSVVFDVQVIGDRPPDTDRVGSKWIDNLRESRLRLVGDRYAVYLGHTQRHGDGIGHQGDLMRYYDLLGNRLDGGWEWGCSHSLDVRLVAWGDRVAAACLSDSHPIKGIAAGLLRHEDESYGLLDVRQEPEAEFNFPGVSLGGFGPIADGVWLSFVGRNGRLSSDVALARLHLITHRDEEVVRQYVALEPERWLTNTPLVDETAAHLARYGEELLATWRADRTGHYAVLNSEGYVTEGPGVLGIPLAPRDDLVTHPDGDVGWTFAAHDGASELSVVRISACVRQGTATPAGTAPPPTATPTAPAARIALPVLVKNMPKPGLTWTHAWHRWGYLPGYPVDVRVVSSSDAWVATGDAIFRWDGSDWRETGAPPAQGWAVRAIDATSDGLAWAVGEEPKQLGEPSGVAYRWEGDSWQRVDIAVATLAAAESYFFDGVVIGPDGTVLVRAAVCWARQDEICYLRTVWLRSTPDGLTDGVDLPPEQVAAIAFRPDGRPVGVGRLGVWEPGDGRWRLVAELPSHPDPNTRFVLVDLVPSSTGGLWATTVTGHLFTWDGIARTLRQHQRPTAREIRDLHLCGAGPSDLMALSANTAWNWDGGAWTEHPVEASGWLDVRACDLRTDVRDGWAIATHAGDYSKTEGRAKHKAGVAAS